MRTNHLALLLLSSSLFACGVEGDDVPSPDEAHASADLASSEAPATPGALAAPVDFGFEARVPLDGAGLLEPVRWHDVAVPAIQEQDYEPGVEPCASDLFASVKTLVDEGTARQTWQFTYDDFCLGGPVEANIFILDPQDGDEASWAQLRGSFFFAATERWITVFGFYKQYHADKAEAPFELTLYDESGDDIGLVSGVAWWDGDAFAKLDAAVRY